MKSSLSTYKNYLKKNLIKFDPNQELAMTAIDQFLSNEFSLKGSSSPLPTIFFSKLFNESICSSGSSAVTSKFLRSEYEAPVPLPRSKTLVPVI